jgi:hypothetical protein
MHIYQGSSVNTSNIFTHQKRLATTGTTFYPAAKFQANSNDMYGANAYI